MSKDPWMAVRRDLELFPGTPSSTHDALTFGEGDVPFGELDLLQFFSSSRFKQVTRVPDIRIPDAHDIPGIGLIDDVVTDGIVFRGGTVSPNETVNLLFGINNGIDVGTPPSFYLRIDAEPVPEPSPLALIGFTLLGALARRRYLGRL